jgi:hypothetical protein
MKEKQEKPCSRKRECPCGLPISHKENVCKQPQQAIEKDKKSSVVHTTPNENKVYLI